MHFNMILLFFKEHFKCFLVFTLGEYVSLSGEPEQSLVAAAAVGLKYLQTINKEN